MISREDINTIHLIAERATKLYARLGYLSSARDISFAKCAIAAEIMIVHGEVIPLYLDKLLFADEFNFAHDIGGIHRHLDHGQPGVPPSFKDCFLPRFAVTKVSA